jgi:hypothetical protein
MRIAVMFWRSHNRSPNHNNSIRPGSGGTGTGELPALRRQSGGASGNRYQQELAGLPKPICRAHSYPGWRAFLEQPYSRPCNVREAETGVPMAIIVGIIGVETIYGQHMGSHRVLDALGHAGARLSGQSPPRRASEAPISVGELGQFSAADA